MTIKQVKKNVSAEDFMNLDDVVITRDANQNLLTLTFKRKNFKTDVVGTPYQLTDDFYTKKEVDDRIKIHFVFKDDNGDPFKDVDDLPVPAAGSNYIYMVKFREDNDETDTGEGVYREYVWVELEDGEYTDPETHKKYGYESIGSTKIDISDMQVISNIVDSEDGWGDAAQGGSTSDSKYPSEKLVKDTFNLLDAVAWSGEYSDLKNTPYIPTKTSDLTNDGENGVNGQKYLMPADIVNYLQKSDVKDNLTSTDTDKPLSAKQGKELKGMIDSHKSDNNAHLSLFNAKANTADLGATAFSNDYGDLNNLPSIPSKTSDLTNDVPFVTATDLATDLGDIYTKSEINSMGDHYVLTPNIKTVCNNSVIKNYTESEKTYENLIAAYDGSIEGALLDYVEGVNHKNDPCIVSVRDVGVFFYAPDRVNNGDGTITVVQPDLISAIPVDVSELDNDAQYVTATQLGALLSTYLTKSQVEDNLNSDKTDVPLSARQGKVLSGKISTIEGAGYITASDAGSLYLPTVGGTLTGPVIHPSAKQTTTDNLVYAGDIETNDTLINTLRSSKSLLATLKITNQQDSWVNIISVRNGNGSTTNGFYISAPYGTSGNLKWKQDISNTNTEEKIILDSSNYGTYANKVTVLDSLESTSVNDALSANQGRVLQTNKFDSVETNGALSSSGTTVSHAKRAPSSTADNTVKLRKFKYDEYGHVTGVLDASISDSDIDANASISFSKLNITKNDITNLGIPAQDTTYSADNDTLQLSNSNVFSIKNVPAHPHDYTTSSDVSSSISTHNSASNAHESLFSAKIGKGDIYQTIIDIKTTGSNPTSRYNTTIDSTDNAIEVHLKDFNGNEVNGKQIVLTVDKGTFTNTAMTAGGVISNDGKTFTCTSANGGGVVTYTSSEWGLATFECNETKVQLNVTGKKLIDCSSAYDTFKTQNSSITFVSTIPLGKLYFDGSSNICEYFWTTATGTPFSLSSGDNGISVIPTAYAPPHTITTTLITHSGNTGILRIYGVGTDYPGLIKAHVNAAGNYNVAANSMWLKG